jgi:imidazoleglycerol-phosphate dehydratase
VRLALDGEGRVVVNTGIGFFDHLLEQMAFHGLLDLEVSATGDREGDAHHVVEDVAIVLGQALNRALGDRRGIARFGSALVPMDEALAQVAIDVDGRGIAVVNLPFYNTRLGQLPLDLLRHFFETLAREARLTIHVNLLRHWDDHHGAEGIFKAAGRALEAATRKDPRRAALATSTKEL